MLKNEEAILDLYVMFRFQKIPPPQEMFHHQKVLLLEADVWMGNWDSLKTRVLDILRLRALESEPKDPLDVLEEGQAATMIAAGLDPVKEAKAKRKAEIAKLKESLIRR